MGVIHLLICSSAFESVVVSFCSMFLKCYTCCQTDEVLLLCLCSDSLHVFSWDCCMFSLICQCWRKCFLKLATQITRRIGVVQTESSLKILLKRFWSPWEKLAKNICVLLTESGPGVQPQSSTWPRNRSRTLLGTIAKCCTRRIYELSFVQAGACWCSPPCVHLL